MKRREFLTAAAISAAGISVAGQPLPLLTSQQGRNPITVFTKCLQFLTYEQVGEVLAETGFHGADMPVRPGGQVLPENVKTDLPKAVKALQKSGITLPMITTSIMDPDDPFTENILAVAAENGVKYYRMGWMPYDDKKSIPQNLEDLKKTFARLEKLNRRYKIRGEYQNHSGRRVGGPVWDLYHILKDIDPEYIGVQYDVRHATAEGGFSWPLGMQLLAPWIGTTDIKDFHWNKDPKGVWRIKSVPLGEGMVDFDLYMKEFKKLDLSDPVSIHFEYDLGGAEHGSKNTTMPLSEIKVYMKQDILFLKNKFNQYQI